MMNNPHITADKGVLVLGLGISGKAAVRYLCRMGAKIYVSDARSAGKFSAEENELLTRCCEAYETDGHSGRFLDKAEMLFLSPGIPGDLDVIREARRRGMTILGELALAAPVISTKVIGVTGTNGKTTVTTLIGELLQKAGRDVFVGGNIGTPLLECLMREEQPEAAVVEISSFQLERAGDFRPDIAVLLNITPDHIDRHGSLGEYIRAKAKIFANQTGDDTAIVCTDNIFCRELVDNMIRKPLTFGHSKDCDSYICESEIYLRHDGEVEIYDLAGSLFDTYTGRLNCAAAIMAARNAGCGKEDIVNGLAYLQPLPHRMEKVDQIDGVYYCNDSKATNTGAVISALQQARGKVVLIAGGRDKGEDYQLLRDAVKEKVRKLVVIGEAAPAIAASLSDLVDVDFAGSMKEAVDLASRQAAVGDTVLLSPACASFDMFDSYGHRGQMFIEAVQQLRLQSTADVG